MCAAPLNFTSERHLIEITEDPQAVLDWVREYREHSRNAAADDDEESVRQLDELIEFALDHAAHLKALRLGPASPGRAKAQDVVMQQPPPKPRVEDDDTVPPPRPQREPGRQATAPAALVERVIRARQPDPEEARRREPDRRRAEERAKEKAAAEDAEAERLRADDEALRQLHERIAKAQARRDAALATTARIEAEAKRATAEATRARREQAMQQAARDAEATERAAGEAEADARRVAVVAAAPASPADPHASGGAPALASAASEGLTPLAKLFREQLGDLVGAPPSEQPPAARDEDAPARSRERARPTTPTPVAAPSPAPPPRVRRAPPQPAVAAGKPAFGTPASPASAPIDDLPPLTGADLASFRNWLAVSQRALAAKLGVEQSSVSRGEGKPTTVLPAALRQALHKAMGEPRPDLAGTS